MDSDIAGGSAIVSTREERSGKSMMSDIAPTVPPSEAVHPQAMPSEAVHPQAMPPEAVRPQAMPPEAVRPYASPPEAVRPYASPPEAVDDSGRNAIFGQLVKSDTDINGLVAYSIYKQNKLDWLAAFEAAKKRLPNEAELSSYIIGEGTPRRLATYRHLADSTLAGQGPTNGEGVSPRRLGTDQPIMTPRLIVTYAILAILFVVGFWLAAHFAMTGH